MKDLLLKSIKTVAILAAFFGVVTLNSCKDKEEDPITPALVEDGFYVQGGATAYTDFDVKATLKTAKNEVLQEDRATLLELYVAVKGGSEGFNIVQVAGAERTTWGPGADWASATGGNEEPQVAIQRGAIAVTATKFTVPSDGLYHVVIDTKTGKGAIVPVEWGIIGQATPSGWSGDTKLEASAFSTSSMTFSAKGIQLSAGEWKFRYSGGWKVELYATEDLGNGKMGVKFNTNFGGTPDMLVAGGNNMATDKSGIYDLSITWTAGEGHKAMITRTGDVPARDYSAVSVGLIGDGVPGNAWDKDDYASTPAKAGDVYTWTFSNVALVATGGFKIRTEGTWDDINLGYDGNIIGGPAAGDIQDAGGNMQVKADGTYDIVFVVDAAAETKSVSFTKK